VTAIEVELLSGRYHAHVWGEAQFGMAGPEWPPSPWRLLRALASAWFCARPRPSSDGDRDGLFEALGRSGPPQLWLPRSSLHEVRYYQPVRLGASDRVLHHDHYAVPEDGRFWFRFNVELPVDQGTLLADLLARLRYLGRSESRARLRVADSPEPPCGVRPVVPRNGVQSVANVAYPRVLCPGPDFRAADLWSVRGGRDTAGEDGHPSHLVDTLLDRKMPVPCGARWIEYAVPTAILVHEIPPRVAPSIPAADVAVAEIRFRLNRRIPISIRYLVAVARAFREAAVEAHRGRSAPGQISRTLTGREADGTIARGHEHAYYLPRLREGAVTIDEIVVRLPGGRLTRSELDAVLEVGHIRVGGRGYPITIVHESTVATPASSAPALQWRSTTPFLPPLRHRRGRDETCPEQQAAACAERLYGRRPAGVEMLPGPGGAGSVSSLLAHEYAGDDRNLKGRRWTLTRRLGFWLKLTFDQPVSLDTPLGADTHFGAGQFSPVGALEEACSEAT
jgi:CRISPR-associated protein Csb2